MTITNRDLWVEIEIIKRTVLEILDKITFVPADIPDADTDTGPPIPMPYDAMDATREEPDDTKTIVMLKEGDEHVKVKAKIEKIGGTVHGDKWKLKSVVLRDATQSIDLVLWNEEIPRADNLSVGDEVLVEAWQVVKYKDKLQLKLGKYGKITRTDGQQQIEL